MSKKYSYTALFILLLISSFTSSASTVVFQDAPGDIGGNVAVTYWGHGYQVNSWGGLMTFDQTGGTYDGDLMPNEVGNESRFAAFCLDWTNYLAVGSEYTLGALSSGIGQVKADDISRLLYNVYPVFGSVISSNEALAIQIAIWEIVHEELTYPNETYNVNFGDISFTWNHDATDRAQEMLDLYVTGKYGPMLDNLAALTKNCAQDLLVQTSAVPIPAAVWLFGSAFAGLVGFGRRREG